MVYRGTFRSRRREAGDDFERLVLPGSLPALTFARMPNVNALNKLISRISLSVEDCARKHEKSTAERGVPPFPLHSSPTTITK